MTKFKLYHPDLPRHQKIKLKLKNRNRTGNHSLKDGESEEFRLLGCYETGHAIVGWQYASEARGR